MMDFPTFEVFSKAVNRGRTPFPWLVRLAVLVEAGTWPTEIGVPTGLGKTSCLDVAVWALARQAANGKAPRTAPTRIWYVVNRRLLVDAAHDHGLRLRSLLANPDRVRDDYPGAADGDIEAVASVAGALSALAAVPLAGGPLHVSRLRGGVELEPRPADPSQPALVFATVPMFASRWLFRGYGTSRSMRSVDAALAGIDSLVLLDEAHLARPLMDLVGPLEQCDLGDPERLLPAPRHRPSFVAMTATGTAGDGGFDLDAADLANPIVHKRLTATKPVRLVETTAKRLAPEMAEQACLLLSRSAVARSCVIFTNSPRQARDVADRVPAAAHKRRLDPDIVVITGRQRDRESEANVRRLLDPIQGVPSNRDRTRALDKPLIVIATQTLEVGADLDFDYLVTETAGARALVQRLGRLNRLGEIADAAGVICHPVDAKPTATIYGDEPAQVWTRLNQAASHETVDLSPRSASAAVGPPADVPPRVGQLLPAHLWEWSKTSCPPPGEAPAELFYAGFEDDLRTVSVCWRSRIPCDGGQFIKAIGDHECTDLPLTEFTQALGDRGVSEVARLAPDRLTVETVRPARLARGDQVVLDCRAGMYDGTGWNPEATAPVLDASLVRPGHEYLPLADGSIANILGVDSVPPSVAELLDALRKAGEDDDGPDPAQQAALAAELLGLLAEAQAGDATDSGSLAGYLGALGTEVHWFPTSADTDTPFLTCAQRRNRFGSSVSADAFDDLSFTAADASLDEHLNKVGELATRIAKRLGLPDALAAALGAAGRLHDVGKLSPRFQRWLDPDGRSDIELAKSGTSPARRERTRVAAGWPRGARHEAISGRIVRRLVSLNPASHPEGDLVTHLLMSHHGHGRPSLPPVTDPNPDEVTACVEGVDVTVSGDLGEPDWEQPARFRALNGQYGYWGLALLEAIVRQADHVVSATTEVI